MHSCTSFAALQITLFRRMLGLNPGLFVRDSGIVRRSITIELDIIDWVAREGK
jgi:hypothetical protein